MKLGCVAVVPLDDLFLAINCKKGRGLIMPGGKWEEGETFEQCASRELREETGMEGTNGEYIFGAPDGFGYYVMAFLYPDFKELKVVEVGDEICHLVTWDTLLESKYSAYYAILRQVIRGRSRK